MFSKPYYSKINYGHIKAFEEEYLGHYLTFDEEFNEEIRRYLI
jgi:hypothetical protein